MNTKKYILLILYLFPFLIFSQEIVFEENVENDSVPVFGRNYKNYRHFYVFYGFIAGENKSGSEVNYGLSRQLGIGYRYKRKITNWYALGIDVSIYNDSYSLMQNSNKTFPYDSIYDKERVALSNFKSEFYSRINFDKRGNYIGNFIDIGVYANYNYSNKHIINSSLSQPNIFNAEDVKQVYTNLSYFERLNYGLAFRFGLNRYVFYAQYRINSILKNEFNYSKLPDFVFGFQIGLH